MSTAYGLESWQLGQGLGYESALWAEGGTSVSMPPVTIVSIPLNAKLVVLRGFNSRSSAPLRSHVPVIDALADNIIKRVGTSNQVKIIRIVGHTDSVGNEDFNFDLGLKRARSTRKLLITFLGIKGRFSNFTPPPFIECSAGPGLPDSSSASDNRRVEIILE
jgi:outer membrane protein OmpA-like peptidoglycan-associated protein